MELCSARDKTMFNKIFIGQVFNKCKSTTIFVMGCIYTVVFFLNKSFKWNKEQNRTRNSETYFFLCFSALGKKYH